MPTESSGEVSRRPLSGSHRIVSGLVVDRVKWEKYDGRPYPFLLSVQERHVLNTDQIRDL